MISLPWILTMYFALQMKKVNHYKCNGWMYISTRDSQKHCKSILSKCTGLALQTQILVLMLMKEFVARSMTGYLHQLHICNVLFKSPENGQSQFCKQFDPKLNWIFTLKLWLFRQYIVCCRHLNSTKSLVLKHRRRRHGYGLNDVTMSRAGHPHGKPSSWLIPEEQLVHQEEWLQWTSYLFIQNQIFGYLCISTRIGCPCSICFSAWSWHERHAGQVPATTHVWETNPPFQNGWVGLLSTRQNHGVSWGSGVNYHIDEILVSKGLDSRAVSGACSGV